MPVLSSRDDMNPYGQSTIYTGYIRKNKEEVPYTSHDDVYGRVIKNGGGAYGEYSHESNHIDGKYDMRGASEPTFEADHLATFDVGTKNGIFHPEDGLRKLQQMEGTMGIWTMRCSLVIERRHLVILDNSTSDEIERFPISSISEPTAILKNDRKEIYNNLVLFTVVDDPRKRSSLNDMHIFQSINTPAQDIVDEILASQSGQGRTSRIPPPPMGPPPEPPYGRRIDQTESRYISSSENRYGGGYGGESRYISSGDRLGESRQGESRYISGGGSRYISGGAISTGNRASIMRNDTMEHEAGQNEALEHDVQLLNHCFDDIEKFVSRLQQAAESYKELERRRRDRGKKSRKAAGDGMLGLRARPPPAQDFIDIFQKFKHSFNLLAKLKAHIHDPNAPELIHFLFTPLSLIYEASRDPYHGGQDLPDQAVSPLLTMDARQLLLHCLTSKEQELWQILGRHWTNTRNEYDGRIPPYIPRFYDGWQPAASWVEMRDGGPSTASFGGAVASHALERTRNLRETYPVENGERIIRTTTIERSPREYERPRPITPPVINTSYEVHRSQYRPQEPSPVSFPAPTPKTREDENRAFASDLKRQGADIWIVEHTRDGRNKKELSAQKGDVLEVLDNNRNWWKVRNFKGEVGHVPYTVLKSLDDANDKDHGSLFIRDRPSSGGYSDHIISHNPNGYASSTAPAPPPLPSRRGDY